LTTQLILADYFVHFLSFMLATTGALVVGKSVLLAMHWDSGSSVLSEAAAEIIGTFNALVNPVRPLAISYRWPVKITEIEAER
jgi:uncharacterized membrane protein YvlD (DUF360 family)